jgi:hypothetical protein
MTSLDRTYSEAPPNDPNAEQAVLGSILLEGTEAALRVFAIVMPRISTMTTTARLRQRSSPASTGTNRSTSLRSVPNCGASGNWKR